MVFLHKFALSRFIFILFLFHSHTIAHLAETRMKTSVATSPTRHHVAQISGNVAEARNDAQY